ncbi:CCZ1 [[Candida] subhashii]|uniref:CCZ1 n=1 Tax=[Candida] subhashii TaxID=561895 RepID=A0A8J5QFR0_9ASCO|nr:CCZ1 [[Candida] subhashii]KAG7662127.1 CCZ1 [[Candida] subhashii]
MINNNIPSSNIVESHDSHIQYLSIINPLLVSDKAESNNELFKQILIFITTSQHQDQEWTQLEKLNLIGLIRGIDSFSRTFSTIENHRPTIIKTSKSSIIILELENDYYIVCSTYQVNQTKSNFINQQLIKLIIDANTTFRLLNMSLDRITKDYDFEVMKSTLNQYWSGFLESYNNQLYKVPVGLKWPNSLNYRGFLGLLKSGGQPKQIAKKSSISLIPNLKHEINQLLSDDDVQNEFAAKGIIISYFGKMNPKQYGLVYSQSSNDDELGDIIPQESLVDIYNWLEYHDYHDKLNSTSLCSSTSSDLFKTNLPMFVPSQAEADSQENMVDLGLRMLHPVNLTNSLVVSPLNYTVNSMMALGNQFTSAGAVQQEVPVQPDAQEQGWLSMPQFLRPYVGTEAEATTLLDEANVEPNHDSEDEEDEDEEVEAAGSYVIGLQTENFLQNISRRLVYIPTQMKVDQDIKSIEREYQLVVFTRDDIYITLIYESSATHQLDKVEFYEQLQHDILLPTIQEIQNSMIGGSLINTSISSLRSIAGLLPSEEVDQDFFYVIFDPEKPWFQSSLPYLPNITNDRATTPTATTRYQMAMYYLHDQLTNLFLIQQSEFFQTDNKLNEYFHKFTSNKLNDWMFYYIRHKNKFIIIIKNRNKTNRTNANTKIVEKSLLDKISDGIVDYAHLGFLDNLGDDVKYWLGQQVVSSE